MVKIDDLRFSPEILENLGKRGHKIETGSTGRAVGIFLDADGILSGAADARGEAGAGGI